MERDCVELSGPGLPDFSWHPKITQFPQNAPNGHKIYQLAVKYDKWP
jgi:hypothetical protein